MARFPQVVIIGDAGATGEKYQAAYHTGKVLGALGAVVITGGKGGVMEAASKGAMEAGTITVGIVPGSSMGESNAYCKVVIPTALGHGRNALTPLSADIVICIGGGAGTLSEMAFAWIYDKPIIALLGHGGWTDALGGEMIDQRRSERIIPCQNVDELRLRVIELVQDLHLNFHPD